jgi:hypothetical protein
VSGDLSGGERLRRVEPEMARMLRVETIFRVADELQGQTVAAKLIDRVHEIANLPECECDVDVSVEWAQADESVDPAGVPSGGSSPSSVHCAER